MVLNLIHLTTKVCWDYMGYITGVLYNKYFGQQSKVSQSLLQKIVPTVLDCKDGVNEVKLTQWFPPHTLLGIMNK